MSFDAATGDGHHFDILITDDDLTLDGSGEVVSIDGRPSIAQDVGHAIRESQLLLKLIGQRSPIERKMALRLIEALVEEDLRIIPGTANVLEHHLETIWVQAETVEYNDVDFYL